MKIVLIESSHDLALSIVNFLSALGHCVCRFDGKSDFVEIMRAGKQDLYIIDFDSANAISPDCIKGICKVFPSSPILLMGQRYHARFIRSAMVQWYSDFIQKPFDFKEIEICLRKYDHFIFPIKSSLVSLSHSYSYDTHSQILFRNKEKMALTRQERILISLFILNRNKVLTEEEISIALYNNPFAENTAIRTRISRLRKKLDGFFIKSYRREGYMWE